MRLHTLASAIFLVLIVCSGLVIPVWASVTRINNISPFESRYGMISVNATVARYSITEQPVYYGTLSENGSIDLRPKSSGDIRWNLTPEENVPEVARQVMESYGGIPLDAQPNGVSTHYLRQYNLSRNEVVSEEPMFTTISYSQADVNGLWVVGDTNLLILDLGDYGELLWIHKIWRDYTYSGNVPVISLNSAFNKFQHGELLNDPTVMNEKLNH